MHDDPDSGTAVPQHAIPSSPSETTTNNSEHAGSLETELEAAAASPRKNGQYKPVKLVIAAVIFVLLIVLIAVIVAVSVSTKEEGDAPSSKYESMPEPGVPYMYDDHNGTKCNLTLSMNTMTMMDSAMSDLKCYVEFDVNGTVDTDLSYITVADDGADSVYVGAVLLAMDGMMGDLDPNCTLIPAVVVTDIDRVDDIGLLILSFRLAMMFDYIEDLDANVSHAAMYDTGVDTGPMHSFNDMKEYFGNPTMQNETLPNGTVAEVEVRFENVSYTQMRSVCWNITEDGEKLNEIPMIKGICDGLSAVDYFGTSMGFDEVKVGGVSFHNSSGPNFMRDLPDGTESSTIDPRRRLASVFRRLIERVVDYALCGVNVAGCVGDIIIGLIRGDINEQTFASLDIDASRTVSVNGGQDRYYAPSFDGDFEYIVSGSFDINAGIDFHVRMFVDLEARYNLFEDGDISNFEYFKLYVGGESHFKAYLDIAVDGSVTIRYALARVDKLLVFLLGPVPVIVNLYAEVAVGFSATVDLNFIAEFGYEQFEVGFGVEWIPDEGWYSLDTPLDFQPYRNLGIDMDEGACLQFSVVPFVELRIGIIFYGLIDIHILPTITATLQIEYPATCDTTPACSHNPLMASFGIDLGFAVFVGLEVGADWVGGSVTQLWELPFDIPSWEVLDTCFDVGEDDVLASIGDACCAVSPAPVPAPRLVTVGAQHLNIELMNEYDTFIVDENPSEPYEYLMTQNRGLSPTVSLNRCEGDCDSDADCSGNLRCGHRNVFSDPLPLGCIGNVHDENGIGWDYCYDPDFNPNESPSALVFANVNYDPSEASIFYTEESDGHCLGTASSLFLSVSDLADGNPFSRWSIIQYKMTFWGSSYCWSMLGHQTDDECGSPRGCGLDVDVGLLPDFLVIQNNLANWDGSQTWRCGGDPGDSDNFWSVDHGPAPMDRAGGYENSIYVQQSRDLSVSPAGIGMWQACPAYEPNVDNAGEGCAAECDEVGTDAWCAFCGDGVCSAEGDRAIRLFGIDPALPGQNLGLCEGDCDDDFDCVDNLVCQQRNSGNDLPPGCSGPFAETDIGQDFCYDPSISALINGEITPLNLPLIECEGDCDDSSDCTGDLKCFHNSVPLGCSGEMRGAEWDYCYDPDKAAGICTQPPYTGSSSTVHPGAGSRYYTGFTISDIEVLFIY